jgi:hypothetical protein
MHTLADRAAETLARHPAPALSLDDLVVQVRDGGAVVGSDVLLRALEARPDLFRVLDPWRGPWRCASPRARAAEAARWPRWIVGLRPYPRSGGAGARLKSSLAWLGRTVDERSALDLVRWLGMVREGERLTRAGVRMESWAA